MTNIIHPQDFRAIRALDAQKRRRPSGIAQDGEYISFDLAFADAAPAATARYLTDAERASIDATVKAKIEEQAKALGKKASEWLAIATPREIERLIESAAKAHVTALGGEGIARGFAMDAIIRRTVDAQHGAHDAKFAFMGDSAPAFDRERAEFLARAKFGVATGDSAAAHPASGAAERTRSLAGARFGDGAKLVDMAESDKPAPRSLNAPTGTQDAAGQSRPAAINALRALRYQG